MELPVNTDTDSNKPSFDRTKVQRHKDIKVYQLIYDLLGGLLSVCCELLYLGVSLWIESIDRAQSWEPHDALRSTTLSLSVDCQ